MDTLYAIIIIVAIMIASFSICNFLEKNIYSKFTGEIWDAYSAGCKLKDVAEKYYILFIVSLCFILFIITIALAPAHFISIGTSKISYTLMFFPFIYPPVNFLFVAWLGKKHLKTNSE